MLTEKSADFCLEISLSPGARSELFLDFGPGKAQLRGSAGCAGSWGAVRLLRGCLLAHWARAKL